MSKHPITAHLNNYYTDVPQWVKDLADALNSPMTTASDWGALNEIAGELIENDIAYDEGDIGAPNVWAVERRLRTQAIEILGA